MSYIINSDNLYENFLETRRNTSLICHPLEIEDYVPQPSMEVSPPKWHLAHTSWFFEQFILVPYLEDYEIFHPDFAFLFNSYYNNMGSRSARENRGFMTRPTVAEVYEYRQHINENMEILFQKDLSHEILILIEIGINHEQQHQELLAYDIKYILGNQPTFPDIGNLFPLYDEPQVHEWIAFQGGTKEIGAKPDSFSFDNELPRHNQFVENFKICNKLVTNAEFLEFIVAGGYQDFNLWHSEGWDYIQSEEITCPMHWYLKDNKWCFYHFNGLEPVNWDLPVMHISYYEAYAFAEWKGCRLPTEAEWEVASEHFSWGQVWEWTQSPYSPYPGFKKAHGALGEYNGKFMVNQMVLRGASGHAQWT